MSAPSHRHNQAKSYLFLCRTGAAPRLCNCTGSTKPLHSSVRSLLHALWSSFHAELPQCLQGRISKGVGHMRAAVGTITVRTGSASSPDRAHTAGLGRTSYQNGGHVFSSWSTARGPGPLPRMCGAALFFAALFGHRGHAELHPACCCAALWVYQTRFAQIEE